MLGPKFNPQHHKNKPKNWTKLPPPFFFSSFPSPNPSSPPQWWVVLGGPAYTGNKIPKSPKAHSLEWCVFWRGATESRLKEDLTRQDLAIRLYSGPLNHPGRSHLINSLGTHRETTEPLTSFPWKLLATLLLSPWPQKRIGSFNLEGERPRWTHSPDHIAALITLRVSFQGTIYKRKIPLSPLKEVSAVLELGHQPVLELGHLCLNHGPGLSWELHSSLVVSKWPHPSGHMGAPEAARSSDRV